MNRSNSLRNKLIYLAVMIIMLLPLYLLGQPATGLPGDSPGELTKMRVSLGLAEASLGEIDPASESMKLASLGMRGPAALLLWNRAEQYKVLHEWDRLSATLNQITHLQPHYEGVWEFQAHNLSYNVSLEFDDYRQRYNWVKKGTEYLTEGVNQNRRAPRLIWYTGWFYGNKLGMSDEKRQFRELFSEDEPFHDKLSEEGIAVDSPDAKGPEGLPDNWLVGRLWLMRGYDFVDGGVPLVKKSPVTFFELGPKWRIQHATAIEEEGILDDRAKAAWERADDDWYGFGVRPLATSEGISIQLGTIQDLYQRKAELMERFEDLVGPTMQRIRDERMASLSDAERQAIETPMNQRSREQYMIASQIEPLLEPSLIEVAKEGPDDTRLKAIQLADEIAQIDNRISKTNIYRDQMNFGYWELRCRAEQDSLLVDARRLLYEAEQKGAENKLDEQIEKYEEAFVYWEKVFDQYPGLILDVASDDLTDAITDYRRFTDQAELPDDFPLKDFYEMRTEADFSTPEEYQRRREDKVGPVIDVTQPYSGFSETPQAETQPTAEGEETASEGDMPAEGDAPEGDATAEGEAPKGDAPAEGEAPKGDSAV